MKKSEYLIKFMRHMIETSVKCYEEMAKKDTFARDYYRGRADEARSALSSLEFAIKETEKGV